MPNIDLNLLRTLHALFQTGSVTRTAQQLGVSQPAVSRALSQLRDAFGDPLLIKTNSGMAFTKRAEALRQPVEEWYVATRQVLRTDANFEPAAFSGRFLIATTDFGALAVVMPAMQRIMAEAPGLELDLVPLQPDSAAQLATGRADLVVTGFDPEDHRSFSRHLFTETYACVMRPDHALAPLAIEQGTIALETLAEWPHCVTNVHGNDVDKVGQVMQARGLHRRAALRVPYFSAIPHIIRRTDALAVVPARAAQAFVQDCGLVSASFPSDMGTFNYWLLWHMRSRHDPATMWIVDRLSDEFELDLHQQVPVLS